MKNDGKIRLELNLYPKDKAPLFYGQVFLDTGAWYEVSMWKDDSEKKFSHSGKARKPNEPDFAAAYINLLKAAPDKKYALFGWVNFYNPTTKKYDVTYRVYLYQEQAKVGKDLVGTYNLAGSLILDDDEEEKVEKQNSHPPEKDDDDYIPF